MKGRAIGKLVGAGAVLTGLVLRLAYATHASPYIDEFTTVWAAQQVLATGLPRFPSGAIYTQGLIFTYLDAVVLAWGRGFNPFVARLPALVLSTATLALTLYAARRLFHTAPLGLAVLWLALDAEAIVWGGRARTYALLQLLVLAAFLAWMRGAVEADRPAPRWLAVGLLLIALADQPLVLLLLPPFAILALAGRGWRWLRQPVVWLQAGTLAAGVVGRRFLYQLMIPAGSVPSAEPRAFVDLTRPLTGGKHLLTFFTDPTRLMVALLLAGGIGWLLLHRRSALAWRRAVPCIAFLVTSVVLEMLLIVGETWREPRYLYPLLPLFLLGGEGVAIPALRGLAKRMSPLSARWMPAGLTAGLVLLSAWLAYPGARAAATREEWGYDRALAVVARGWTEGDALATIAPAAAFALLGHGDYLAVEEKAQAWVVERHGQSVDGWTALPLLDSPQRLAEALNAHPRLWFVADEMRLDRHFSPEFLHLLWDRFDLVAFERGVFVFRSRPAEPPPAVDRPLEPALWSGPLRLDSFALSEDHLQPGETLTVTLRWWSGGTGGGAYTAFVHLVDRAGAGVAGHDGLPLGGLYPVERWPRSQRSQPFPDRHRLSLPADLPPGRYRLETGLYESDTLEPAGPRATLDFVTVGREPELPSGAPQARFTNGAALYLHGLEGERKPGSMVHLRLVWQAGPAGFDTDYTLFLHLLDAAGHIAQQWDAPPVGGWYPTSYWDGGEVVVDDHELDLSPELAPGAYRLIAGLYRADGERLPLENGPDFIEIATIELEP